jgi:hypothetical protein
LHAYKYGYKEICVETEIPEWATPDFKFEIKSLEKADKADEADCEQKEADKVSPP